jgi:cytochrome c oxidase subunit 3
MKRLHPWHLVTVSPWPFFVSFAVLFVALGFVRYVHFFKFGLSFALFSLFFIFLFVFFWWRDVIRESILGFHSASVKSSLRFGFVLFILSEVMFFFGIFWTLFYFKLAPEIQVGVVWPPEAIFTLNPLDVPFFKYTYLGYFRSSHNSCTP